MLHYLDLMIGFAFTMLVISLTVTAMVQAVPIYLRNLKGASLHRGLADLLMRIEPTLTDHADLIVGRLLRDPLLVPPRNAALRALGRIEQFKTLKPLLDHGRSSVIHREEFVRLLLDFAAGNDADDTPISQARNAVRAMFAKTGITNPAATLASLRNRVAELERDAPAMSSSARASKAMLEVFLSDGGGKPFLAKLVGWYDQTMDRVKAVFTSRVRVWTVAFSVVLVLVLHLDTFDLIARLNVDKALRDKLVTSAVTAMEKDDLAPAANSAAAESRAMACARSHLTAPSASTAGRGLAAYADCMGLAEATRMGMAAWPEDGAAWAARWSPPGLALALQLLGMSLSVAMLSLGAPFWYEMLSNLIKLRSTLSRKDEAARVERQTDQTTGQPTR